MNQKIDNLRIERDTFKDERDYYKKLWKEECDKNKGIVVDLNRALHGLDRLEVIGKDLIEKGQKLDELNTKLTKENKQLEEENKKLQVEINEVCIKNTKLETEIEDLYDLMKFQSSKPF